MPDSAPRLVVGLDPGRRTGYALALDGGLVDVAALSFWDAARRLRDDAPRLACVVIEDARRLPVYHRHDSVRGPQRDRLVRGVGHVDRDTALLADLCARLGLPVALVPPPRPTWRGASDLLRLTGWTGRTCEHARDAARLVVGLSAAAALHLCASTGAARPDVDTSAAV